MSHPLNPPDVTLDMERRMVASILRLPFNLTRVLCEWEDGKFSYEGRCEELRYDLEWLLENAKKREAIPAVAAALVELRAMAPRIERVTGIVV